MRWIFVLLLATVCLGQPVEGPFLIYDDLDEYGGRHFFVWHDSITAHVFDTRRVDDDYILSLRNYSLVAHRFTINERILYRSTIPVSLDTVAVSGDNWAVFTGGLANSRIVFGDAVDDTSVVVNIGCQPGGAIYGFAKLLLHRGENNWTFAWFFSTTEWHGTLSGFCGQIVNINDGLLDSVLVQAETMEGPIHGPNQLSMVALDEDSFAVFHNHHHYLPVVSLVGRYTELDEVAYAIDESDHIGRVLDAEWLGFSRIRVLGTGSASTLHVIVLDIEFNDQASTQVEISGPFSATGYCRVPGRGWAIIEQTDAAIRLLRIDTYGVATLNPDTLIVPDEYYQFEWARITSDTSGNLFVYYEEVLPEVPPRDRVQYVSLHWDTPLESQEPPLPLPSEYSLSTYPNPFNATVRIDYDLPRASEVEISIHNTLGQQVATLFTGRADAGTNTLNWSPDAASGVYFVKLVAGDFVTSRKILYVR